MLLVFALAVSFPNETGAPANAAAAAQTYYSFYTDIALLVLVGLGFLMSFLVRYAYSSLGFTLLLTAFTLQWTILVKKKKKKMENLFFLLPLLLLLLLRLLDNNFVSQRLSVSFAK